MFDADRLLKILTMGKDNITGQNITSRVSGYRDMPGRHLERIIRANKKPLAQELINTNVVGRDYQIRAICTVMEAIEKKQRKHLLSPAEINEILELTENW